MEKRSIVYFDAPGNPNTDEVMKAVAERVERGGITHVVVASGSGETGEKALARLKGRGVKVVVVTEQCGASKEGECEMSPEVEKNL